MRFTLEQVGLRHTSENEPFPWTARLVTLLRIGRDGSVQQAKTDGEKAAMLGAAREGDLVLAAWPGDWSQDIFVVDDLRTARIALGVPRNGVEATNASEPAAAGPVRDWQDTSQLGLWSRLAEIPDLPVVAQRELANRSFRTVEPLLGRSDLDPEIRAQIIDNLPVWSASSVVTAGMVTAAEVERLLDHHTDSTDLLMAALQRPDVREAVEHRVRQLSYEAAARLWVEGKVVSETARLLLPVILAQDPRHPLTGYQAHRYKRASLVRSMIEQLPESERRHWIHHAEHQSAVRRAMLTGAALSDEELLACLPEVTRSATVTPGQTPPLLEYLRRYPQLIKLAKSTLAEAATQLVRDGWSPNQAAQTGQWADLVTVARVVEDRDLIEALVRAAVFDNPSPSIIHRGPWREPLRYELVDLLVSTTAASDDQISYLLNRISPSHLEELHHSAGKRSRLRRLTTALLADRHPRDAAAPLRWTDPPNLPTDEELSHLDEPAAALLELWRNRPPMTRRETVASHILSSRHTTEDLVWRLPIVDIEQHPVWGPRLADKVSELCGDSPARWQELSSSWGLSTQLLARTLFSRLESASD